MSKYSADSQNSLTECYLPRQEATSSTTPFQRLGADGSLCTLMVVTSGEKVLVFVLYLGLQCLVPPVSIISIRGQQMSTPGTLRGCFVDPVNACG